MCIYISDWLSVVKEDIDQTRVHCDAANTPLIVTEDNQQQPAVLDCHPVVLFGNCFLMLPGQNFSHYGGDLLQHSV